MVMNEADLTRRRVRFCLVSLCRHGYTMATGSGVAKAGRAVPDRESVPLRKNLLNGNVCRHDGSGRGEAENR